MTTGVDFGRYKRLVQYFWDPEPGNDDPKTPIWCLGQQYSEDNTKSAGAEKSIPGPAASSTEVVSDSHIPESVSEDSGSNSVDSGLAYTDGSGISEEDRGWPGAFLDDFESRAWLTYRSNFPPIPKSQDPKALSTLSLSVRLRSQLDQGGFSSDAGWGCMIRSGQSVLANAFIISRLGRSWRRGSHETEEKSILSLFADDPAAPFSIHKFVAHGELACGKHPGEWFGPSATARCIQ
jgi:cysteine protease ATG4